MLREWEGVRQRSDEGRRRWFTDEDMDLIVWYEDDEIRGFQLCYNKQTDQHALTWFDNGTYSHARIDDGEKGGGLGVKETPILVQDGTFDSAALAGEFREHAGRLDPELATFVYDLLKRYPDR